MLETAIIGGGVCGLALAKTLHAKELAFALFEARGRLGGRVYTVAGPRGEAFDLGPGWIWPETQPLISRLIAELGLVDFPQHDSGTVLVLRDFDKRPEIVSDDVHNGARRLAGGMASLVNALAADLPQHCMQRGHILISVRDRGEFVDLVFQSNERLVEVAARRVVLAIPPWLLAEHVLFEPELDAATSMAMRGTETWMAAQAKVLVSYDRAYWREEGKSGNAFVTHEQAVLGEIFDACDTTGAKAALGGFLALSPELRQSFSVGLPMLMDNQMSQIFGEAAENGTQHYQDWALEPFTCSALDRTLASTAHPAFSNSLLRQTLWNGKLFLGSSETAAHGNGYLEGAVEAAKRISREIVYAHKTPNPAALSQAGSSGGTDARSMNIASLARFEQWVAEQDGPAIDGYRHRLNRGLAAQQRDQLTQRAVLGTVEEVFSHALGILEDLPFDMDGVAVERGRSALTPEVQAPFRHFMQTLLDNVAAHNATSCALSNFPEEHHLSKDYMQTILRDMAAAWQEFSRSANALILNKTAGEFR
jgi:monoamine oxidase